MRMLFPLPVLVAGLIFAAADNVKAATTFLPDWSESGLDFNSEDNPDISQDEDLCIEAVDGNGNRLYHMADGCPVPKKFDEYCAHDDRYISECYCHEPFVYTCTYPYKGDTREVDDEFGYSNCDDLWVACCDTTCPAGSSTTHPGGCPNTYGSNGCGETCYGPYQECCYPESDETGCSCGTTTCGDGCGGTRTCCAACPEPEEPEPEPTPDEPDPAPVDPGESEDNSNPCAGVTCPTGKSCSKCKTYTSNACCSMVCTECDDTDPCAGQSCPTSVACGTEGCASYSTKTDCCPSVCTKCNEIKTCTPVSCSHSSKQTGEGWSCTSCTGTKSDCSTYSGSNCTYTKPKPDCSHCNNYTDGGGCRSRCIWHCERGSSWDGKIGGLTCAIR